MENRQKPRKINSKGCQCCTAEENILRNENYRNGVVGAPGLLGQHYCKAQLRKKKIKASAAVKLSETPSNAWGPSCDEVDNMASDGYWELHNWAPEPSLFLRQHYFADALIFLSVSLAIAALFPHLHSQLSKNIISYIIFSLWATHAD